LGSFLSVSARSLFARMSRRLSTRTPSISLPLSQRGKGYRVNSTFSAAPGAAGRRKIRLSKRC
jgi:hypothetical protein